MWLLTFSLVGLLVLCRSVSKYNVCNFSCVFCTGLALIVWNLLRFSSSVFEEFDKLWKIAHMQSTCMKVNPFNLDNILSPFKHPICVCFALHVVSIIKLSNESNVFKSEHARNFCKRRNPWNTKILYRIRPLFGT